MHEETDWIRDSCRASAGHTDGDLSLSCQCREQAPREITSFNMWLCAACVWQWVPGSGRQPVVVAASPVMPARPGSALQPAAAASAAASKLRAATARAWGSMQILLALRYNYDSLWHVLLNTELQQLAPALPAAMATPQARADADVLRCCACNTVAVLQQVQQLTAGLSGAAGEADVAGRSKAQLTAAAEVLAAHCAPKATAAWQQQHQRQQQEQEQEQQQQERTPHQPDQQQAQQPCKAVVRLPEAQHVNIRTTGTNPVETNHSHTLCTAAKSVPQGLMQQLQGWITCATKSCSHRKSGSSTTPPAMQRCTATPSARRH